MTQARRLPSSQELLAALDPDQRQVAEHLRGPLCVLAGAGTGKTRAITYRIAHGVVSGQYDPRSVLAVTFTARAAGEMRTRLADLGVEGVQARTFHAAALRQLRYFWPSAVGGSLPHLLEHKAQVVAGAAGRVGLNVDRPLLRDLAAEVEWAKVSLVSPEDYVQALATVGRPAPGDLEPATVAHLLEVYEKVKIERGLIDFEDVLLVLNGILLEREDIAKTVRAQYSVFVVDEYQDVSPLQQALLDRWLGGRTDLCVVGDVAQTIYSFTGATPRYLTSFARRYPGARTISLVRDYRSTPQVVSLANAVLAKAGQAGRGRLAGAVTLQAQRPSSVPVRFETYDDDRAEATGIASHIQGLVQQGVALSEIAVLYRTNGQTETFEEALSAAGIGYQVRGGERFFARPEVRQALGLLRSQSRTPTGQELRAEVEEVLTGLGWSPQPPAARGALRERWDSLQALAALAQELQETRGADLVAFVAELEQRAAVQHAPSVQGVTLASLHAAKGLEWDAVFLAGMSDGLLPISLAETPEAIEEERRLLYVGVTRAREHLMLSYARARTPGAKGQRKPSRFLQGIWPTPPRSEQPERSRRAEARHRAEQFALHHDARTLLLFEELKEWRAQQARSLGRPAYTVLHDTTLQAIAVARPTNLADLAQVRGIGLNKLEQFGADILALCQTDGVADG
ncbi:ATP-dependent DNA helicase UvrD2 [Buchananella hordeovulneris]|uniref:ATP-dependent DNA helicase UvrD2 n=1 Tax=Buchananella hordeovulneris TaxID=52770 RepID=UPI000F5FEC90|nr:ATP-dependent DNA helicase UvrD2 [Buchananella hordeovulneris]RRD53183.1 ATP-dependent DNA helicase UvrD2 [Buchananella hordeovulneris]